MKARALEPLASRGGRPVRDTFLALARPALGPLERARALEALDSGWITSGPRARELGERLAARVGARHGVALQSATGALHLALAALGVGPGDEVVTSTYTFVSCAHVIDHL